MKVYIFPVILASFMISSVAQATPGEGTGDNRGAEAVLSKSAKNNHKKSRNYSVRLTLGSNHRLNLEPDNAEWITSLSISASYRLGKALGLSGWGKYFGLSASWSTSNEIVGNSAAYRTSYFSNPSFLSENPTYLGVDDGILSDKEAEDVPREIDGTQKRIDYSDVVFTLSHGRLAKLPWKVGLSGSIGAVLPISLQSRNKGLITKIDYSLGLDKSFKINSKISLSLAYNLTFTHYLYKYVTPTTQALDEPITVNGRQYDTYTYENPVRNNEFAFTNALSAAMTYGSKWRFSMTYGILTMRTYGWDDCSYTLDDGQVINVCETTNDVRGYDDGGRGRRDYQMFSLAGSYRVNDMVSVSAVLNTFTPQLKPDAHTYQQPFISMSRNNYSSLLFRVTVSPEKIYDHFANDNKNVK